VELLPAFQFDAQSAPPGQGRVNYWGYAPVSFFAPHQAYSSRQDPVGPVDEFRDMVKALHRAGIEVILDVVFNHTAEGDHLGPTLCYRGLENAAYYILQDDPSRYADYTGTGNTLNGNQPIVRRLIVDSLRYWVECMHVDGFRFDLASILSRDEKGRPLENPPVLWDIESDPVLAGTKLIAEAWDAAGLYQLGSFVGDNWKEWNGRFRDDVRSFMKGDPATEGPCAACSAADLYSHEEASRQSINFVTCHDGYAERSRVVRSQAQQANGEGNATERPRSELELRRGTSDDVALAPAQPPGEDFIALTPLAVGTPPFRGRRSPADAARQQQCLPPGQQSSWFDWSGLARAPTRRFMRLMPDAVAALGLYWRRRTACRTSCLGGVDRLAGSGSAGPATIPQPRADGADADGRVLSTSSTRTGKPGFEPPPAVGVHQGWRRVIVRISSRP
jgi:glycogen operon protein